MIDGWNDNYLEQLESLGITCLYHITDKDNVPSILKERRLSSWRKISEEGIAVPRPGGDAISHRLDARNYNRDGYVHLYATEPSEALLEKMQNSKRFSDLCVLTVSLKALRPGSAVFWIGDPYSSGERFDNVRDLVEAIEKSQTSISKLTVDIKDSVHYNYIINTPKDIWARISEVHPTAVVFVVDQSCSMARGTDLDNVDYDYISELAAISVNQQIDSLLKDCIADDGTVSHLYDIAVIGYGNEVSTAWNGSLAEKAFHTPMELLSYAQYPETQYKWVNPKDSDTRGRCDLAFEKVFELLKEWVTREENRFSYPPTVIHISDGDVKREFQRNFLLNAEKLKELSTEVGKVIVWNICYFPVRFKEYVFVSGEELMALTQFPGGLLMYEASSYLPETFKEKAARFHHGDPNMERKTMGINVRIKRLFEALRLCVLPQRES